MRTILAAAAVLASLGTSAQAVTMGSAPAYGGPTQSVVVCYYSNIGSLAVTFSSSVVLVEPGVPVAEASEFCGGNIPGGGRCRTVSISGINTGGAHWCTAVVSSKATLRGRMEIRNSSGTVLSTQNIQ